MRNKSLIHTKDVKTQEGTPLHLEYYLLNDSLLDGCAECYGVEILAQTGEAQCYAASRASPCAAPGSSRSSTSSPTSPSRRTRCRMSCRTGFDSRTPPFTK